MTPEAADSIGTSSSTTQQFCTLATVYSAHVPFPLLKDTFLPTRCYP